MSAKTSRNAGAFVCLALGAALALASCATSSGSGYNYNYGGSPTNTTTAQVPVNLTCASGATVCTKQVAIGGQAKPVLATTSGMTLYYFEADTATTSACSGSCGQTWPALTVSSGASVTGSGLSGTLKTLSDANGNQVTYNGHPLYTYSGDHAQTDANGNGIGGQWYAAYPSLAASGSRGSGY
jgi:predicted lipoprotein with Yx(FWY)xxD motif